MQHTLAYGWARSHRRERHARRIARACAPAAEFCSVTAQGRDLLGQREYVCVILTEESFRLVSPTDGLPLSAEEHQRVSHPISPDELPVSDCNPSTHSEGLAQARSPYCGYLLQWLLRR
jgi:hypothetical protein